jgi:hypothetical protein
MWPRDDLPRRAKGGQVPEILVTTNSRDDGESVVLLQERIGLVDLESDHYSAQLIERLGWALVDADDLEGASRAEPSSASPHEGFTV